MSDSYKKYSGQVRYDPINSQAIKYNQSVKEYYILKYNNNANIAIDIGSGKGKDIQYWINAGIKFLIGIEPSQDSIISAIRRYKNERNKIKITYLNGVGNKDWNNGDATLRNEDRNRFIDLFNKSNIKANAINLCFTIHYMMSNKTDFDTLFNNMDNHLINNGKVVILFMDGLKMHKLLQANNGVYSIKNKDQIVFQCTAKYDYTKNKVKIYGTPINVFFLSVTGLENAPDENLVVPSVLKKYFRNKNYELIENKKLSDVFPDKYNELENFQKEIVDLYRTIVFEKKMIL